MLDVGRSAGDEVIDGDDVVPLGEEALAEVRTDEAAASGDQCAHAGSSVASRPTVRGPSRADGHIVAVGGRTGQGAVCGAGRLRGITVTSEVTHIPSGGR